MNLLVINWSFSCREQQLVMASTLPIMKHSASRAIKYPNVYDSIAEAKQSSCILNIIYFLSRVFN